MGEGLTIRAGAAGAAAPGSVQSSLCARQVQQPVDDRGLQGVRAGGAQRWERGAHRPGADPVSAPGRGGLQAETQRLQRVGEKTQGRRGWQGRQP